MEREEKTIVALTGCSHALNHGYLLIFPAVLLLLKEEYAMGYLGLGVVGTIMSFAYGLGALPGGMIYNQIGPKRLYLVCFLGSSLVAVLVAFSSGLIFLTAGLALLGVLGSVYHPLANALITSKVRRYGIALGIHGAAGNLGVALTPIVAGFLASLWGWRHVYLLFAVPGLFLCLWSFFIDLSVKKEEKLDAASAATGRRRNWWAYFTIPMIFLYVLNCLQSFSFYGATTFLPAFIAKHTSFRVFSWDSVAVAGMLSGLALMMGVFGQYTGGILAQRLRLERNLMIMTVAAFPFILLMSFLQDLPLLGAALIFFFFSFSLQPMMNGLLAQYTPVSMRGTGFGIYFFAAFGIGSFASSFSGYIAENFGLQWVFLGLSGSVLLAVFFCFLLVRESRVRSAAKMETA